MRWRTIALAPEGIRRLAWRLTVLLSGDPAVRPVEPAITKRWSLGPKYKHVGSAAEDGAIPPRRKPGAQRRRVALGGRVTEHLRMRGVALVVAMVLAGCGGSGAVEITDGWAGSMPPSAATAAIYLTIENGTARAVRIVEVTSPRCGAIELHESRLDDQQIMRMRPATDEAVTIAAGATFEMIPGAFHVMCIDVLDPFEVTDRFPLTVVFDDGTELTREIVVENR